MKCPHCRVEIHAHPATLGLGTDADGGWLLWNTKCPACQRLIFMLLNGAPIFNQRQEVTGIVAPIKRTIFAWPRNASRGPCHPEVPAQLADDYHEACFVLDASPKASAALSRRCLQNLLRTAARVKNGDLFDEIQQILDSKTLPTAIAEAIDAVRAIGNFAAHPIKSQHTGEVLPVEPGEAEWNLDVLEALFDFYFVQPSRLRAKKDALNKKLQEAGKPPIR